MCARAWQTRRRSGKKLFGFLAVHFRLLPDIWRILDRHFLIEEEQAEFEEHLPAEFVRYMLSQIHGRYIFPMNILRAGMTGIMIPGQPLIFSSMRLWRKEIQSAPKSC